MAQMTDDEKIAFIALMLGDIPGGPYYPMFTPEQYASFLKASSGNLSRAIMLAALSASYQLAGESSRETIGELSISNSTSSNYLKLLDFLQKEVGKIPPQSMMPWFAGMNEPDCNKLLNYHRCDKDWEERWTFIGGPPKPCGDC
ncbi:hypothetical protein PMW_131 [Pseudomonas phage phiPMW]|uniref:Uncharacterized protein n=1 Tax=Pseudomonas phage phiPMW TaxID=1815582 RepID=A0A1S5R1H3_9CAUD|nr:hypothetical protein FDG97_gp219 [Pseudomonas phage phiPMW]ANA49256.1 hypothetical protein PMW_131 [Pseudomonas phage phiPMW]